MCNCASLHVYIVRQVVQAVCVYVLVMRCEVTYKEEGDIRESRERERERGGEREREREREGERERKRERERERELSTSKMLYSLYMHTE